MAFQSNAFQGTAFQMRRPDQRRPGSVLFSWHDGVRRDKRVIKPIHDDDDDLLMIAKAFIDHVIP